MRGPRYTRAKSVIEMMTTATQPVTPTCVRRACPGRAMQVRSDMQVDNIDGSKLHEPGDTEKVWTCFATPGGWGLLKEATTPQPTKTYYEQSSGGVKKS